MGTRLELHEKLKEILGSDHVYFQPPENIKLVYPCILYELNNIDIKFADNLPYHHTNRYTVTVIDRNPDSEIPSKIARLPMVTFDRFYTEDNLNHTTLDLYY